MTLLTPTQVKQMFAAIDKVKQDELTQIPFPDTTTPEQRRMMPYYHPTHALWLDSSAPGLGDAAILQNALESLTHYATGTTLSRLQVKRVLRVACEEFKVEEEDVT